MLPGPVSLRESLLSGVDGFVLPTVQLSVLANRADLYAYPTGRDALAVQLGAVGDAAIFVREPLRVVPFVQCSSRAHPHATHASGAQAIYEQGIGRKLRFCEYRAKAHPRTELAREQHVVRTEIAETRQKGSMSMREEGQGFF